jgi:hypothetical protein
MADVVNPDFEVDLSGWTKVDSGTVSLTDTRDTGTFHSGAASLKLVDTLTVEDDYYKQSVSTKAGFRYSFEAWCNCTVFTGGAVGNFGIWAQTGLANFDTYSKTLTAVTNGWQLFSLEFPVRGPDDQVEIRLYAPNGTVFWDDVSLRRSVMPRADPHLVYLRKNG